MDIDTLWKTNNLRTGKSPFVIATSTISMAMFNSKLLVYQRVKSRQSHPDLYEFKLAVFARTVQSMSGQSMFSCSHIKHMFAVVPNCSSF